MISLGFFGGGPAPAPTAAGEHTCSAGGESGACSDGSPLPDPTDAGSGPAGRGSESGHFPTLLLALASIATPVQAMAAHPARGAGMPLEEGGEPPPLEIVDEVGAPPAEYPVLFALIGSREATVMLGEATVTFDEADGVISAVARLEDGVRENLDVGLEAEPPFVDDAELGSVDPDMFAWVPLSAADTVTLDPVMVRRLAQDFVPRLERVAERMWEEHGLRIDLVEGFRPQSRQNALFAQGRTAEGPVVTWTQRSLHTAGAAADVYIDGAPVTPEQAVILHRVAKQEGLRTLYPFDSGHIQLDRAGWSDGPEGDLGHAPPRATTIPAAANRPGVAPVAPVAAPARPARPGGVVSLSGSGPVPEAAGAPVDGLQPVAGPDATVPSEAGRSAVAARHALGSHGPDPVHPQGSAGASGRPSPAEGERPSTPNETGAGQRPDIVASGQGARVGSHGDRAGASANGARAHGEVGQPPSLETLADAGTARKPLVVDGGQPDGHGSSGEARSSVLAGTSGARTASGEVPAPARGPTTVAAARPAALPNPTDGTQAYAYRRLHLPIEGVGGQASLDVGIRPGGVDASLNVSDPVLAHELRGHLHELRQTLADRGVDTRGLSVRLTGELVQDAVGSSADTGSGRSAGDGSNGTSSHEGRRSAADRLFDERERDGRARANQDQTTEDGDAATH